MILLTERIDNSLKKKLQTNIRVTLKDKILAEGKLIIYKIEGCIIQLRIDNSSSTEECIIPYPFNINDTRDGVVLDYTIHTLADGDSELLASLQHIHRKKDNKVYNSTIVISNI